MREVRWEHDQEPERSAPDQVRVEPTDDQLRALSTGRADALTPDATLRMQQHAGNAVVARSVGLQRSKVHEVVERPSGKPIPSEIARTVEASYGPLPADARMHTDSAALDSAREVGAYAYASGRDIVIPEDAPREIQLEEAFHLAQQQVHGDVAQTDLGNGVMVSDDNDRYEREAQGLARQHAAGAANQHVGAPAAQAATGGGALDDLDGLSLQRSLGPEAGEAQEEEQEEEPEELGES